MNDKESKQHDFIPVCEPLLLGGELELASDAIASGWISSSGKYVTRFEEAFANYVGSKHAISTTSGTAALHLACVASGLGKGDEVIVPTFTMSASAFSVIYCGAVPVFVDCEATTLNLDVEKVEAAISPRTRAIMPVHIYGHPCDMAPIQEIANKYDLRIIEDAAEAIGSRYKGALCGAIGDAGCFSFFANKTITTGEGGMVTTDSDEIAEKCKYYKNMCFSMDGVREYNHKDIGYNYRMPNVNAAIGLAQVKRVEEYVERRRANARLYNLRLDSIVGITTPKELDWALSSYWMYAIRIEADFPLSRDRLMDVLRENGVESRKFFVPMHEQPAIMSYSRDTGVDMPVSEQVARQGMYLPSGSGLSERDINYVCDLIEQVSRTRPDVDRHSVSIALPGK